ncbi:MAG: hypothetical protein A3E78_07215 [Alphaproteobacteria bacterium RIFCSPHIGHO2_12_FULL_63_12]|nr:MAG: hypothetical protein A3E78_07215 [Alphaproteobacteria bacterium RIFCSPHIGHO2_12_FULL_63_12]
MARVKIRDTTLGGDGDYMRFAWLAGVLHGLIGTAIFFLTLHPLRDALDAHSLDLAKIAGAWQAMQGLVLMIAAVATRSKISAALIAGGTFISCAMLYFIIFTGLRPPIIVIAPIGGAIAMAGWIGLFTAKLRDNS